MGNSAGNGPRIIKEFFNNPLGSIKNGKVPDSRWINISDDKSPIQVRIRKLAWSKDMYYQRQNRPTFIDRYLQHNLWLRKIYIGTTKRRINTRARTMMSTQSERRISISGTCYNRWTQYSLLKGRGHFEYQTLNNWDSCT